MGVLSKLLGGAPAPKRFAKMMEAELRTAGVTKPIQFDAEKFTLKIGGDRTHDLYLGNALAEYQGVPAGERRGILQRYARLLLEENEATLDDVRANLLPRIRQRVFYYANAFSMAKPGTTPTPIPHRVISEHLAASSVVDYPERIEESFQDPRERWGVSLDELLEIGAENLWTRSQERFNELAPGVWQSPWRDNHDASRLYLPSLIRSLRVKGDHVAMVPNRDTLLVTGSEDEKGLSLVASIGEKEYQDNRSISGILVTLDGAAWTPFMVTPGHPAFNDLNMLRYLTLGADYADQKSGLEDWHTKSEIDIYVASLQVFQKDDYLHSVATWSETVTTLLPVADEVAMIRCGPDQKPIGEPVIAKWARVLDVVGGRMQPQDVYPPRFLVESFPSEEQLRRFEE